MDQAAWNDRVWLDYHARRLKAGHRDVLLTLKTYCGNGEGWPSHATLAERSGKSSRTVARALAAARDLGLVTWREVRRKIGGVWRRATNRYRLTNLPPIEAVVEPDPEANDLVEHALPECAPLIGQFGRTLGERIKKQRLSKEEAGVLFAAALERVKLRNAEHWAKQARKAPT